MEQPNQDVDVLDPLGTVMPPLPIRRHKPLHLVEGLLWDDGGPYGGHDLHTTRIALPDLLHGDESPVLEQALDCRQAEGLTGMHLPTAGGIALGAMAPFVQSGSGILERARLEIELECGIDHRRFLLIDHEGALILGVGS